MPSRHRRDAEVWFHPYLIPALEEAGWSAPRSGRLIPAKISGIYCSEIWVGVGVGPDGSRKSRSSPGFERRTVHPVAIPITPSRLPIIPLPSFIINRPSNLRSHQLSLPCRLKLLCVYHVLTAFRTHLVLAVPIILMILT
jgi:hypothetical protein